MSSSSDSIKLVAVFCLVEVPGEILTTFLERAYASSPSDLRYAFVTSRDASAPLHAASPPLTTAVKGPIDDSMAAYHLQEFEAAGRGDVNLDHFVLLDEHSLAASGGCVVGGIVRGEDTMNLVRCAFSTSLLALRALEGGKTWPDLWLDAALAGGMIPEQNEGNGYRSITDREEVRSNIDRIVATDHQPDDQYPDQPFAVFCSADVPVEVINRLLSESESPDKSGLCIVDTLNPGTNMRTTTAPLQTFTSPFVGKDIAWILDFVHTQLPSSSMDNHKFLVLDDLTVQHSTVLHVDGRGDWTSEAEQEEIPGLLAVRETFEHAFNNIIPENGPMSEFTNVAALNRGGIYA